MQAGKSPAGRLHRLTFLRHPLLSNPRFAYQRPLSAFCRLFPLHDRESCAHLARSSATSLLGRSASRSACLKPGSFAQETIPHRLNAYRTLSANPSRTLNQTAVCQCLRIAIARTPPFTAHVWAAHHLSRQPCGAARCQTLFVPDSWEEPYPCAEGWIWSPEGWPALQSSVTRPD